MYKDDIKMIHVRKEGTIDMPVPFLGHAFMDFTWNRPISRDNNSEEQMNPYK
jgi:hypothetical protein